MQTLDPSLVSAITALSAAVLMVHASVGKRLLSWRDDVTIRWRPLREPRCRGRSWIPGGRG